MPTGNGGPLGHKSLAPPFFCNYTAKKIIEFDPTKSARNARARGLPLEHAADFDWETAIYWEDTRKAYSERRIVGLGYLEKRLHVLCFVHIPGGVRIISFRKANSREIKRYEQETAN